MNETFMKLSEQFRRESNVKSKLLSFVLFKSIETFTNPPDWQNCCNVSLDLSETLHIDDVAVMINNIAGFLVYNNRNPVDICLIKTDTIFEIVVKYEDLI